MMNKKANHVLNRKYKFNRWVTFCDEVFLESKRLRLTWNGFLKVFYFLGGAAKLDSKKEKTSDTKGEEGTIKPLELGEFFTEIILRG